MEKRVSVCEKMVVLPPLTIWKKTTNGSIFHFVTGPSNGKGKLFFSLNFPILKEIP